VRLNPTILSVILHDRLDQWLGGYLECDKEEEMGDDLSGSELLWRQYNLHVDLYKFYLDIALKMNVFFYLITGGILSFYLANSNERLLKYSFLLPIILSIAFGVVFIYGSILMSVIREDIFRIRDRLNLEAAPDVRVLSVILRVFAGVFFIVAASMIMLIALR
jgi:hypothetical protein